MGISLKAMFCFENFFLFWKKVKCVKQNNFYFSKQTNLFLLLHRKAKKASKQSHNDPLRKERKENES